MNSPEIAEAINKAAEARAAEIAKKQVEEATNGLIKKNQELLGEKKKIQEQYKVYEELGIDPESYKAMIAAEEERKKKEMSIEERFQAEKAEMAGKHNRQVEELSTILESKNKAIEAYLIDGEATRAISALDGVPELLLPVVKSKLKVFEEGGKHFVRVLGDNNEPRIGSSDGSYMTIQQYVQELKDTTTYSPAFKPSGASGAGAEGNKSSSSGAGKFIRSKMSVAEKAAYISEHGYEAFNKIPYN